MSKVDKLCAWASSLLCFADKIRLLHLSVAIAFAEQLQKDVAAWEDGRPEDVSLAAKWAPTPQGMSNLLSSHSKVAILPG